MWPKDGRQTGARTINLRTICYMRKFLGVGGRRFVSLGDFVL